MGKRKDGIGALLFSLLLLVACPAQSAGSGDEPKITASSAILVEASTGRVIYEKHADERRPPASMTKMMTCILGLENMGVLDTVAISPRAAMTEDSALALQPGDQVDAQNLLLGMMMVSDNGAAVAIAEHIDGSVAKFAGRMNEKAREIGCTDTNFRNPNGLPNAEHLSTARDMAKIAVYCMQNQEFRGLVGEEKAVMRWKKPMGKFYDMENTNDLLGEDNEVTDVTGIKTGWTKAAGGCLAASAKRGGLELIAVVMNADDTETRFSDAKKLLDYGFSHVRIHRDTAKERVAKTVWVKGGKDFRVEAGPVSDISYPLIHGESAKEYSMVYELPRIIEAPVKKGQVIGRIVLKCKQKEVGSIDMIARQDVSAGFGFLSYFFVGLMSYLMK